MNEYSDIFRLIFFVIGVYMVAELTNAFFENNKSPESERPKCPPHKWTVEKDIMQCTSCRFIAGTHKSNLGDYS